MEGEEEELPPAMEGVEVAEIHFVPRRYVGDTVGVERLGVFEE